MAPDTAPSAGQDRITTTAAQPTHALDALGRLWRIVRADGRVVRAFVEGWCVIRAV